MENLINGTQILDILKLGLIGLVFLIIFFTYLLLRAEQNRDSEPREKILKAVQNFSKVTLIFAVVVGLFSIVEITLKTKKSDCAVCKESLEQTIILSNSPEQSVNSLRQLIKNRIEPCVQKIEAAEK